MKTNKLISEGIKVDADVFPVTSAAASTSLNYDMQHYNQALVNVCVEGTAGFSTVSIDLMETSAATVAGTSAAGGKAGIVLGGAATLISTAGGARQITLSMTSVTSGSFTLKTGNLSKKFTYTTSTALNKSTAQSSTNLYFGSTVDSTANTGMALAFDSLATAINSTLAFGPALICTTGSTGSITIQAADAVVGNLGVQTTDANLVSAAVNKASGAFNITDDQMTSTANKRYIGVKVSSASTPTRAGVTVLRSGGSYMPPTFSGKLST